MVDLLLEDPNIQSVLAAGMKDDTVLQGYIAEVFRAYIAVLSSLNWY